MLVIWTSKLYRIGVQYYLLSRVLRYVFNENNNVSYTRRGEMGRAVSICPSLQLPISVKKKKKNHKWNMKNLTWGSGRLFDHHVKRQRGSSIDSLLILAYGGILERILKYFFRPKDVWSINIGCFFKVYFFFIGR